MTRPCMYEVAGLRYLYRPVRFRMIDLCLARCCLTLTLTLHTCILQGPLAANCTVVPAPCDEAMGRES